MFQVIRIIYKQFHINRFKVYHFAVFMPKPFGHPTQISGQ